MQSTLGVEEIFTLLKDIVDPEYAINIVDLGLIRRIEILPDTIEIDYTVTTAGCPIADMLQDTIQEHIESQTHTPVVVKLVMDPPWYPNEMSDEAKLELGFPI